MERGAVYYELIYRDRVGEILKQMNLKRLFEKAEYEVEAAFTGAMTVAYKAGLDDGFAQGVEATTKNLTGRADERSH